MSDAAWIAYCGHCTAWTMTTIGTRWHSKLETWCCDACYSREDGAALWFWC